MSGLSSQPSSGVQPRRPDRLVFWDSPLCTLRASILENELLVGPNDRTLAWCGHLRVLQTVLHVAKRFYHESNSESRTSREFWFEQSLEEVRGPTNPAGLPQQSGKTLLGQADI